MSRGIHVLLLISIRVFFRLYQRFFAEYWQKVHSLNSAQFTGLDTVYGKFLERWMFGIRRQHQTPWGDVNIGFPGVGVNIRFPRVGDVNISPGWVNIRSVPGVEVVNIGIPEVGIANSRFPGMGVPKIRFFGLGVVNIRFPGVGIINISDLF